MQVPDTGPRLLKPYSPHGTEQPCIAHLSATEEDAENSTLSRTTQLATAAKSSFHVVGSSSSYSF